MLIIVRPLYLIVIITYGSVIFSTGYFILTLHCMSDHKYLLLVRDSSVDIMKEHSYRETGKMISISVYH